MLQIIFSHWAIYLFLTYILTIALLSVLVRNRPAPAQDAPAPRRPLTSASTVAATRTGGYRRVGSSALPAVYQYGRWLGRRSHRRWAAVP
jgi:hypothetical protein